LTCLNLVMLVKIVKKHENIVYRILEIIPGVVTWAFILSPIWLGLIYPNAIIYLLTFLSVYWAYLAIKSNVGVAIGYKKHKDEMGVNWWAECKKLDFAKLPDKNTLPDKLEDLKHFVLVPAVNEPYEVLFQAFNSILSQTYPLDKITLVYTVEQRCAEKTVRLIKEITEPHKNKFESIQVYVHPAGIPGEAIGAGAANRTWGAKKAVKSLGKQGAQIKNYIFTTFDADHVPDPQYLARMAHLYLSTTRRNNHFYTSAVPLFNNNLWNAPLLARIEANLVTLGTLSNWALTDFPFGSDGITNDTFAAYSSSLQTLIDADYWDVSAGVDDSVFYWRAFFARKGDFLGVCHYIPYSADAVEAETTLKAYKSLYKQLLRWGWGVMVVPMFLNGFLIHKEVPLKKKLLWIYKQFKIRTFFVGISFLITFGFAMLTFANPNVKQTSFAYAMPQTVSYVLTSALLFLIPTHIYKRKIGNPIPEDWPFWKKLATFLEGPAVILNLLTYSLIPFVDAQTRMMLGKKMKDLYHTPKVRKE
jgi:hypothetical protein